MPHRPRPSRSGNPLRARLLAAIAAGLPLTACQPAGAPAARTPVPPAEVRLALPEWRELARSISVSGSLRSDEEVIVSALAAGRVVAVHADFGDAVPAGGLLLQVDPTHHALAREERARAFEQALAGLGLAALPGPDFDLDALPAVRKALALQANAEQRLQRGEKLAGDPRPVISEQELTELRAARDVAGAEVEVQRREARIAVAQARALEAQSRSAEQRLADTEHRAPRAVPEAAFRVAERMVAVGDYVAVGAPLFRLVDADPCRLRVRIPERHLGAVAVGQPAAVRIEAYGRSFAGALARISPVLDEGARAFDAEILLPNPDGLLKPGAFATAEIRVGTARALMVPESCVRRFAGVHKVLRVQDGRAEERTVELGARDADWVEILAGVEPEDALIRAPDPAIVTGTAVTVAAAGGSDASPR